MKIDLHVHSIYSRDSFNRIKDIGKAMVKKGLGGVAVTDHNTLKGGLAAKREVKEGIIIAGAEYNTDVSHMIALFIEEEIKSRNIYEFIDEVHDKNGLVILPHPFDGFRKPENLDFVKNVDAVEAWNSRCYKVRFNELAKQLAIQEKKPQTGGSDAHFLFEIGNGYTTLEASGEEDVRKGILKGWTKGGGFTTPFFVRIATEVVKQYKKFRQVTI